MQNQRNKLNSVSVRIPQKESKNLAKVEYCRMQI